jgi:hypothetical protein
LERWFINAALFGTALERLQNAPVFDEPTLMPAHGADPAYLAGRAGQRCHYQADQYGCNRRGQMMSWIDDAVAAAGVLRNVRGALP